jgi:glycosyltransferase involved in cell wall biosynthesis
MKGAAGSRRALIQAVLKALWDIRPDVVIFAHVNLARMSPLLTVLRPNSRSVVMVYGIEVWRQLGLLERIGTLATSEFWSISNYTAKQLRTYNNLRGTPIYLLPLAIEEGISPPTCSNGDQMMLSVCRLEGSERYKGVDLALRTHALLLKGMPELRYDVVGDGTDLERLRRIAHDLGTEHRVAFLGRVTPTQLAREYANCSVFVLPSRKEGFGIVFLEAMARGKPIVAFRSGGTPEVVEDGETGILVDPEDLLGLYNSLRFLLERSTERNRLGDNGRRRVQNVFSHEAFVNRVNELLDRRGTPIPG